MVAEQIKQLEEDRAAWLARRRAAEARLREILPQLRQAPEEAPLIEEFTRVKQALDLAGCQVDDLSRRLGKTVQEEEKEKRDGLVRLAQRGLDLQRILAEEDVSYRNDLTPRLQNAECALAAAQRDGDPHLIQTAAAIFLQAKAAAEASLLRMQQARVEQMGLADRIRQARAEILRAGEMALTWPAR